jgi:integration host factor subunit alpha
LSLIKKDIIYEISDKANIDVSDSSKILDIFIKNIIDKSDSNIVKISNFGSFYRRHTPQRYGRNPKTKEDFIIHKKLKLFFKSSNLVKNKIN